jgi:hypothetical protein
MELQEAIIHAKKGNALLFTGAGFSYGAQNSMQPPLDTVPDARTFAKYLASKLGSDKEYPLNVVSQAFKKKEGEHGLVRELLNNFLITKVAQHHLNIASLSWPRVYTTNYDNCFELAAAQSTARGSDWTPLTTDSPITGENFRCIHINGHLSNITVNSLGNQVRLTHSSYSSENFANSKWSEQLRQDANFKKAVIFVGYSMSDLDIARIFSSSPAIKERTFFIVSPADDEITTAALDEYGSVLRIGVEGLAKLIESTRVTFDPSPHQYSWLIEYVIPVSKGEPPDLSAIELIVKGDVDQSFIAWDMASSQPNYCVRRTVVDDIIERIKNGNRWFLCHADLGNGKSIVKEQLSFLLEKLSYRVFWDSDNDSYKGADLRALSNEKGNIAVILDASSERFEVIDGLLQLNLPNIVVIVCTRTTLYELGEARYESHMPSGYIVVDLNRLTEPDALAFVRLFNRLGLWGDRARGLDSEKTDYIRISCNGAISRLIVSVFEESDVGRRIQSSAKALLNDRSDLASVVIGSFLVNRIGHAPTDDLLNSLLNKDIRSLMKSAAFKEAAEFVRYDLGKILIRSSIISDYLLRTSIDPKTLIWHIEKFVRRLAEIRRNSALHHIFTELHRFPVLSAIMEGTKGISRANKKTVIVSYYQSIKDLPFCQKNALFWLHYAMARLEFNEFSVASHYFEQAKEFAKGSESDTRDVNNHYAKFLIDSRTRSDDYSDHFKAFELAHQILIGQMNRDSNRHFPYRQAIKYTDFISFRGQKLSAAEVSSFVTACKQVEAAIQNTRGPLANSTEVRKCKESMGRAIEIAQASSWNSN